jgi:ferric-dicitrate binding protein FerR (iron transport regulator)
MLSIEGQWPGRVRICAFVLCALVWYAPSGGRQAEAAQRRVLGSVSAVGGAEVRGISVAGEATVFAGDRIETRGGSWLTVHLTDGPRIELGADSDVRIDQDDLGYRISMAGGQIALSSPSGSLPMRVELQSLAVEAPGGAAAEISWLEPRRVRVRALRETVTVVQDGEAQGAEAGADEDEVIINLDAGVETPDGAASPSNSEAGAGSSTTTWVLVGAGAGGGVGTLIFLAGGEKEPASPTAP